MLAGMATAQDKDAKVEAFKLTENIYRLVLNDIVNVVAFIGPDGVLLVDSGFDRNPNMGFVNSPAAVREALQKLGNDHIRYIIDTHTDLDHAYGNAELGKDAVIIGHQLGRERLLKIARFPKEGLPGVTFRDSLTVYFNGEQIDLFYLPGHTNHDIAVHFKNAKVVCVGDLIIPDSFGSISQTGNVHLMIKAMDVLHDRFADDVTFVAGHDRPMKSNEIKIYKDMIEKTLAIIENEIKKGKSLEQMQQDDILKDWKKWNGVLFKELDANTWITMIYTNIIRSLKPSAADKLGELVRKSGFEPARKEIDAVLGAKGKYFFLEGEFNVLGYNLINEGKLKDAIEVFKITVELYPASWNAYDSLGEAYAADGNKELAVKNYQRSLELNPQNANGANQLTRLKNSGAGNLLNRPESIIYDKAHDRYLLSNYTTGDIVQIDGQGRQSVLVKNQKAIQGLEIVGNTVYVGAGASVRGFDLETGAMVLDVAVADVTNLNDVTADDAGNLYASDVFGTKIIKVGIKEKTWSVFVDGKGIDRPNGIFYDRSADRILVCSYRENSPIQAVSLADATVTTLAATDISLCDGITLDKNGRCYVTSWKTRSIYRFDKGFVAPAKVFYANTCGPADISYDAVHDSIAVPLMECNGREIVPVDPLPGQ